MPCFVAAPVLRMKPKMRMRFGIGHEHPTTRWKRVGVQFDVTREHHRTDRGEER